VAPLIGLTTEGRLANGTYSLALDYVGAVRRGGGIPVLLSPGEPGAEALLTSLSGLILSGGRDLNPARYGAPAHPLTEPPDHERDATELLLTRHAIARRLPVLGICRGIQVMNVALGGTLIQHLEHTAVGVLHQNPSGGPISHPVLVEECSHLRRLLGRSGLDSVSSWHHQGIGDVAGAFRVAAVAPDGLVEAIELPDHPWCLAVQWHPEIMAEQDQRQQWLFDSLIEAATRVRSRGC
jgi:putative glutamine amidotransferase